MLAPFPHSFCADPPGVWCSGYHELHTRRQASAPAPRALSWLPAWLLVGQEEVPADRAPVPIAWPGLPAETREDALSGRPSGGATEIERRAMAACELVRAVYARASGSLEQATRGPTGHHADAPGAWPAALDAPDAGTEAFPELLEYHLLAKDMPYGPLQLTVSGQLDESPLPLGKYSSLVKNGRGGDEDWLEEYGEGGEEEGGGGSAGRGCERTCRPPFTADEALALIRARNPKTIKVATTAEELAPLLHGSAFEATSFADVVAGLEQLALAGASAAAEPLCPQKRPAPGAPGGSATGVDPEQPPLPLRPPFAPLAIVTAAAPPVRFRSGGALRSGAATTTAEFMAFGCRWRVTLESVRCRLWTDEEPRQQEDRVDLQKHTVLQVTLELVAAPPGVLP